jgi:hypothetical protein
VVPFRSNPYGNLLQGIVNSLRNPAREKIDSSGLFEYANYDPVEAIEQEDLAAGLPDKVCIIGGGIAGLTAAYELSRIARKYKKPTKISVFERSARIGGRILTHHFRGNIYSELGPMRLPAYHKIFRHYIAELGLTLQTFPTNATYHLSQFAPQAGRLSPLAAGHVLSKAYGASVADGTAPDFGFFFPGNGVRPPAIGEMDEAFLTAFKDNLKEEDIAFSRIVDRKLADDLELYANFPQSPRGHYIEGISIRQGFLRFIADRAAERPELSRDTVKRCGEVLWDMYARTTGTIWLEHISMAHFLRETAAFAGGGAKYTIKGGFGKTGRCLH